MGVPGEYSAKEKYLAGIFGFDRFIPAKRNADKNRKLWLLGCRFEIMLFRKITGTETDEKGRNNRIQTIKK